MKLSSRDPEPPEGTEVMDIDGSFWRRSDDGQEDGHSNWLMFDYDGYVNADPETWTKVAGNYGPVEVISNG